MNSVENITDIFLLITYSCLVLFKTHHTQPKINKHHSRNPLDDNVFLIAALISSRNQYNNQPVGLIFKKRNSGQCSSSYQEIKFNTTLELDVHHHHLLRSDDDQEALLGICSVIYWSEYKSIKAQGNFNSSSTISAETLTPKIAKLGSKSAAKIVRNSIDDLDHRNYEQALIGMYKLLNSRLSLVSTLLAFIDPENVGVFDDQLTNLLVGLEWDGLPEETINPTMARPRKESVEQAAHRFHMYCRVLQQLKNLVNKNQTGWKDTTDCQMFRFRSIDIQRGLSVMHHRSR